MNFEVLKRSNLKKNIIIGMVVILILSAVILTFTRAKYRVTQSMPLVSGTINFSPYDFNVVAMYLNKGDETVSTKKAPHVGYTLNSEQSTCVVDDEEVENGICRVRAGEYEVAYEASQPLKKKYSIDSTMEELLNHPDIRAFLSQMMEVDMIPDIAYGLSLRDVAKIFAGEIKKDEAQMLDMALAKF